VKTCPPGEEVPTTIEIDNLLVNFTPGGSSPVSLSVGKFDVPLGFERDDEPLNLQATPTFNFELGRPVKMVGGFATWSVSPTVDLTVMGGDGWDSQIDPNHGKTGGARVGFAPVDGTSFGVGGLFGPKGDQGDVHNRWVFTGDYALEPARNWIIAGEGNYGGEKAAGLSGEDAKWYGGTLSIFGKLGQHVGATLRGETFRDDNGARTGDVQTLQSITFTPVYFIGTGREGIFANVEHTRFRIPRFQIRAEARYDHSSIDAFETDSGTSNWQMTYVLQLVATF
jgi:Putative beta-barrel porin-2, OmpL-like. bbp2